MLKMLRNFMNFLRSEKGQTTIEYLLVIVLIVLVIVLAFQTNAVENAISKGVSIIANMVSYPG